MATSPPIAQVRVEVVAYEEIDPTYVTCVYVYPGENFADAIDEAKRGLIQSMMNDSLDPIRARYSKTLAAL